MCSGFCIGWNQALCCLLLLRRGDRFNEMIGCRGLVSGISKALACCDAKTALNVFGDFQLHPKIMKRQLQEPALGHLKEIQTQDGYFDPPKNSGNIRVRQEIAYTKVKIWVECKLSQVSPLWIHQTGTDHPPLHGSSSRTHQLALFAIQNATE